MASPVGQDDSIEHLLDSKELLMVTAYRIGRYFYGVFGFAFSIVFWMVCAWGVCWSIWGAVWLFMLVIGREPPIDASRMFDISKAVSAGFIMYSSVCCWIPLLSIYSSAKCVQMMNLCARNMLYRVIELAARALTYSSLVVASLVGLLWFFVWLAWGLKAVGDLVFPGSIEAVPARSVLLFLVQPTSLAGTLLVCIAAASVVLFMSVSGCMLIAQASRNYSRRIKRASL